MARQAACVGSGDCAFPGGEVGCENGLDEQHNLVGCASAARTGTFLSRLGTKAFTRHVSWLVTLLLCIEICR